MRPRKDIDALVKHLTENRGLRVALIGGLLVFAGLMLGAGSVWTVPALILGSILVLAGALGTRLSGRLALDWGEGGASFEMRARIAPASTAAADQVQLSAQRTGAETETSVIESSGETIEMDLIKLRSMLPETPLDTTAAQPIERRAS